MTEFSLCVNVARERKGGMAARAIGLFVVRFCKVLGGRYEIFTGGTLFCFFDSRFLVAGQKRECRDAGAIFDDLV